MNDTHNPQTAAADARANYREVTARLGVLDLDSVIPESVRALAESTVDQTREAYHRSTDAFDASVATFEKTFSTPPAKAPPCSTARSSTSPDGISAPASTSPRELAGARPLTDMVELQTAYRRKQIGTLTAQAEEVRELSTKVTADAAGPSRRTWRTAGSAPARALIIRP